MSNSRKKMDVVVTRDLPFKTTKRWVKVRLKRSREFLPSFEDLHRIVRAIGFCEDEKYPGGKGRRMVAEFLYDAAMTDDFSSLAQKYQIPIRCGDRVVNDNGAKVDN